MLAARDLRVGFVDAQGTTRDAVRSASLTVHPGQIVAVVGESGSGKSVTALALMGLLPPSARVQNAPPTRAAAGPRLAMIFQEPMSSLNPSMTIGDQIAEAVTIHQGLRGPQLRQACEAALADVGITDAKRRLDQYPHEFSGGMCQRVMIAMALACRPDFLIADEPTTALDATVQAQILDLIASRVHPRAADASPLGVLLITHDLGVVAQRADVVCVMYSGRVVEYGRAARVLRSPMHPYTQALLGCAPRLGRRVDRLPTVAEVVTEASLIVHTPLGERTAWWPAENASSEQADPALIPVAEECWLCIRPQPDDPAPSAPDLAPLMLADAGRR
jgi:ABC-type dipeptide/oligopeptide/nickel transport system ATPase component